MSEFQDFRARLQQLQREVEQIGRGKISVPRYGDDIEIPIPWVMLKELTRHVVTHANNDVFKTTEQERDTGHGTKPSMLKTNNLDNKIEDGNTINSFDITWRRPFIAHTCAKQWKSKGDGKSSTCFAWKHEAWFSAPSALMSCRCHIPSNRSNDKLCRRQRHHKDRSTWPVHIWQHEANRLTRARAQALDEAVTSLGAKLPLCNSLS